MIPSFFKSSSLESWRKSLTAEDQAEIDSICADLMESYEYC